MSTSDGATKAPAASSSKPTEALPTDASRLYANVHPSLLLLVLLFSFKHLVHDPVSTLLWLTPVVAIMQAACCILCLPYTGQGGTGASKSGQKRKAAKPAQDALSKVVPASLSLTLTLAAAAPVLCITVILFGAPLTTHWYHTGLLAIHLALLTTPHLFYTHGLDAQTWRQVASLQLPIDPFYGMSIGACLGAWIGAIPIPLDWDREWQKWPVTIIAGMYAGAVVGKLAGGHLFKGSKIKIS